MQNNKKKTSMSQFKKLCNSVFALSQNIRFAGVIDKMGKLAAGGMKEGLMSMEDKEDSSKLYLEFLIRSQMRKDYDAEFGKVVYSFSEREKIKFAVFPLQDNHILMVSIEKKEADHDKLIQNILTLTNNNNNNNIL
jgi:hypothetical protein